MARSTTHAWRRRGLFVVVTGPDGAGKTTVVDHVVAQMAGRDPLHLHHRPRVLGGLTTHTGPVTEPHRQDPYPWPVSAAKLLFVFLDHLVGWWTRLRPHLRRGDDVLLERGWWDLAVDPRRYRMRAHPRLVSLLGRLLPRPSATIVLVADVGVLATRTTELEPHELERQVRAWRQLPRRVLRAHLVDAGRRPAVVLAEVDRILETLRTDRGATWTGLPRPRHPRWVLPRRPGRATASGLRVYSPVTPRGLVGWVGLRVLAPLGAGRLLPRSDRPDDALDGVRDVLPRGGTVAVGHGRHPGRIVVLVIDPTGHPCELVKLSADEQGAVALAREARMLEQLREHLPAGLHAPRILDRRPGRLRYEALVWTPRPCPWVLPPEVAGALGRFFASGRVAGRDGPLGPAHGDCAPWNLLRARGEWFLVDWSDASDTAPAFTDPWHYLVQAHALLGRPSRRELVAGLAGSGRVASALQAYAVGAGLQPRTTCPGLVHYLERSLPQMDPEAQDGRRGMAARRRLLDALPGGRG